MDEQYVIKKIRESNHDNHHIPHGVLYSQLKTTIQKDLSACLNRLFGKGEITSRKTLNDILININEDEK